MDAMSDMDQEEVPMESDDDKSDEAKTPDAKRLREGMELTPVRKSSTGDDLRDLMLANFFITHSKVGTLQTSTRSLNETVRDH